MGYRVILYFVWLTNPELANLLDLYIPIVNTTCVSDGVSFPPIPIAEIDGENELALDYNS
jgi:hypothetical protein